MKQFELLKELNESDVDESILGDLTKSLLPKSVLHWLKRASHKDTYIKILKLQHKIMKDQHLDSNLALIKAAGVYGISAREMIAVMNKDRRHN